MPGMDTSSGEDLVRAGYDALSHRYRGDDDSAEEHGPWLADLQAHLLFPIAGMSLISGAAAAFRLPGASQPPVTG